MGDQVRFQRLIEAAARRRRSINAIAQAGGSYEDSVAGLLSRQYPSQAAFVSDPSRLLAGLGTRRSGKSSGWLRKMVHDAAVVPDSYQVYINTSKPECRRIAWRGANPKDGIIRLNKDFELGAKANKGELTLTFPNNSVIELIGADDIAGIERAVGTAPHRVVLDEAQKMPHLEYLLQEILGPSLEDFDGQFVLIGTAHRDCSGLFYEVTSECEHEDPTKCIHAHWGIHKLSIFENPHFQSKPGGAMGVVTRFCERFGLTLEDPEIRRVWFGEWVTEDANFVYHVHRVAEEQLFYADARWITEPKRLPPYGHPDGGVVDLHSAIADLPSINGDTKYDWFYGLGVDLGYDPDPFVLVLWAWSFDLPYLFEVMSWKKKRLIPDEQAQAILDIARNPLIGQRLSFGVADAGGLGKGIVESWLAGFRERYPLPLEAAEKSQKEVNIELMNNDIRSGRIKLRRNGPLAAEMFKLTWGKPNAIGKRNENCRQDKNGTKRNPNDCCDGALYAFRKASHHRYEPGEPDVKQGTQEWLDAEEADMEAAAEERGMMSGLMGGYGEY